MARIRLMGDEQIWREMIERGEAQAHCLENGLVLTKIVEYSNPKERVLTVLLLTGHEFGDLKHQADEKVCEFAKAHNCGAIEFICRPGVAKGLTECGYRTHSAVMRKELT